MSTDVRGRIAIDVQFWDRTSSEGVQSLKTIALQDSTEYTSGKVAVVTGTVGTAATTISIDNIYKDASGELVDFTTVERFALKANPEARVFSGFSEFGTSRNNQVAVFANPLTPQSLATVQLISAQSSSIASYTLVIYGT